MIRLNELITGAYFVRKVDGVSRKVKIVGTGRTMNYCYAVVDTGDGPPKLLTEPLSYCDVDIQIPDYETLS